MSEKLDVTDAEADAAVEHMQAGELVPAPSGHGESRSPNPGDSGSRLGVAPAVEHVEAGQPLPPIALARPKSSHCEWTEYADAQEVRARRAESELKRYVDATGGLWDNGEPKIVRGALDAQAEAEKQYYAERAKREQAERDLAAERERYLQMHTERENARAERDAERERREKAEANYRWMVERAADQKLDGYRELGAKAAAAENRADAAERDLRELTEAVEALRPRHDLGLFFPAIGLLDIVDRQAARRGEGGREIPSVAKPQLHGVVHAAVEAVRPELEALSRRVELLADTYTKHLFRWHATTQEAAAEPGELTGGDATADRIAREIAEDDCGQLTAQPAPADAPSERFVRAAQRLCMAVGESKQNLSSAIVEAAEELADADACLPPRPALAQALRRAVEQALRYCSAALAVGHSEEGLRNLRTSMIAALAASPSAAPVTDESALRRAEERIRYAESRRDSATDENAAAGWILVIGELQRLLAASPSAGGEAGKRCPGGSDINAAGTVTCSACGRSTRDCLRAAGAGEGGKGR